MKIIDENGNIIWNHEMKNFVMEHLAFFCKFNNKTMVLSGKHKIENRDLSLVINSIIRSLSEYDERIISKRGAIKNILHWALTSQKDKDIYLRKNIHVSSVDFDEAGNINSKVFLKHTSGVGYKHELKTLLRTKGIN
tara:strand:- start:1252 stop:1662 length:411 start_codon:yes stop_codon:yes gene_type:complete